MRKLFTWRRLFVLAAIELILAAGGHSLLRQPAVREARAAPEVQAFSQAIVDYDSDGWADLYVTGSDGPPGIVLLADGCPIAPQGTRTSAPAVYQPQGDGRFLRIDGPTAPIP